MAPRIYFNPNFEYVLVGDGLNYMTINGDFHYDFPTRGSTFVWAGAGLGLVRVDPDGPDNSDTDPALNLFAGVGWRPRRRDPLRAGQGHRGRRQRVRAGLRPGF